MPAPAVSSLRDAVAQLEQNNEHALAAASFSRKEFTKAPAQAHVPALRGANARLTSQLEIVEKLKQELQHENG